MNKYIKTIILLNETRLNLDNCALGQHAQAYKPCWDTSISCSSCLFAYPISNKEVNNFNKVKEILAKSNE